MGHWGQGRVSQGILTATATEAAAQHPLRSRFWVLSFLSGEWGAFIPLTPAHEHPQSCSCPM